MQTSAVAAVFLTLHFITEISGSCIERSFTNAEVTVCAESCVHPQKVKGCVNSNAFAGNVVEVYLNTNVRKFRRSAFINMPHLKGIYATNIGLEVIFPGAFTNLPEIQVMDLSSNRIEDIVLEVFNNMSVESLNLSFNNISYIDRGAFSRMLNLRTVLLSKNSLLEFSKHWFMNSTSVEIIDLSYNNISILWAWAFDSLPNLMHLDVSFNQIVEIGLGAFTSLKQLNFLDLTGNNLTEINPNVFDKGIIVKELRFPLNRLSVLSEQLFNDGKVHAVSLHSNPWNCMGLKSVMRWAKQLFEEHGELLALFEKFKELKTRDDQANSLELAEHASTVMNTLDEGIKGLDNLDAFFEFLHQVGASHRQIPGFKVEYFWKIEKPFLEAVKTTLGDRYTENVEAIYKITIKFIIETLIEGYDNANALA